MILVVINLFNTLSVMHCMVIRAQLWIYDARPPLPCYRMHQMQWDIRLQSRTQSSSLPPPPLPRPQCIGYHPRSCVVQAYALCADCIFTEWAGGDSPLQLLMYSISNVVDTVFRNMGLDVEIADVSDGGVVHFDNVKLANVSLANGQIVSTSRNDFRLRDINAPVNYYTPEDDAEFDVEYKRVPVSERGMFGEDFLISNQTMSDCVNMRVTSDTVMPGCPPSSVQRRQDMAL